MSLFSSSEQDVISRSVDVSEESNPTEVVQDLKPFTTEFEAFFDIVETADKILEGDFKRIALQFPDPLLKYSVPIYQSLRAAFQSKRPDGAIPELYVLADTSYGSCCVDEVAAQHVDADALVHYGHACLSQQSRLPVIYVFTKKELDIEDCVEKLVQSYQEDDQVGSKNATLKYDVGYSHLAGKISASLSEKLGTVNIAHAEIPLMTAPAPGGPSQAARIRSEPDSSSESAEHIFYVGPEGPGLRYILLNNPNASVHIYSPTSRSAEVQKPADLRNVNNKFLMRRYAAIQKARDADVFGLLVGTLGVASYLPLLQDLRSRIKSRQKKPYTVSVGKLTPAKLANFMEIDCWVVVACREGSIGSIGDKEFYKPIITPYELIHALTPPEDVNWTGKYELEFDTILEQDSPQDTCAVEEGDEDQPHFSLVTGKYRHAKRYQGSAPDKGKQKETSSTEDQQLSRRNPEDGLTKFEASSAAAQFLHTREYQGLDPRYGADEPSRLEQGRKGVAKGYGEAG